MLGSDTARPAAAVRCLAAGGILPLVYALPPGTAAVATGAGAGAASVPPSAFPLAPSLARGVAVLEAADYLLALAPSPEALGAVAAGAGEAAAGAAAAAAAAAAVAAGTGAGGAVGGAGAPFPVPPCPAVGFGCPRDATTPPEAMPDHFAASGLPSEARKLLAHAAVTWELSTCWRVPSKGKPDALVPAVLVEAMKLPVRVGAAVAAVHAGAHGFLAQARAPGGPTPAGVGNILRRDAKELWPVALLLAAAVHLRGVLEAHGAGADGAGTAAGGGAAPSGVPAAAAADVLTAVAAFGALHRAVGAWHLDGCWAWRPLLDGKAVSAATGVSGPALGGVMDRQAEWRLEHPHATVEDALAWLASVAAAPRG
jgi:hypothetical protein